MTAIHAKKKDTANDLFFENYTYNTEEQIQTATNPWDGQKEYTYTPEGFLKTVKKGYETITYSYDSTGNLLKAVTDSGKILVDNQYSQGNRISTSVQYDASTQTYQKVTYAFRPDGSLLTESISKPVSTAESAAAAPVETEKEYHYQSINLLLGITTKKNGKVTEKIEFTYDSENKRTSKKVTTDTSERTEFYYYDANGDLVSISQKNGIDPVENLMNFYRDANGNLLSFEYKKQIYDYVYNQRGDIVAITNEVAEIVARYTYDEWGNLQNIDAPTALGAEVANVNPFRYVGKFGVQYDNHTKLYYMGWRDYDAKIGRFLVADEYEGEDTNPISFNRYLYAESDPVNNIDPDGHAPKWLKKVTKGVKKAAKATYNFAVGDDIKTLQSKNTKWYQKAGAAVSIASNFIPGGSVASKVAKVAIKGTAKAATAVKASKAIVKSSKVVKSTAKKAASTINKKPKVVPAPSIKSAPKTQSVAPVKVSNTTPAAKPKVASAPQPKRGLVATRSEANANVAPPAGKGCNCFTAGTKVVTEDGEKNIEDIEVGDKVLAKDEKNADGELAYKEVEALYRNQRDDIIKLHVGDQIIETTDNHPFWVEGKGWVFADELKAGDQLQKADGTNLTIDQVEFIKLDKPVTVYNFTVEDYHTYYVTDIGIWVHNTQCSIGTTKGTGNRPPNLTPAGAGRNGAFREAKRNSGIPVSQQPKKVTPAVDRRGNKIPGRDYDFGDGKIIRDHSGGHEFPDDPRQNRGPHFNDVVGEHYDY